MLHVAQLVLRHVASEVYAVLLLQDGGGLADVRQLRQLVSLAQAVPSLQQKSSRQVVQAGNIDDTMPQLVAPPAPEPLDPESAPPAPVPPPAPAPPAPPPHCDAQLPPRQPLNALNAALFAHEAGGLAVPTQVTQVVSPAQAAPWLQQELSRQGVAGGVGAH